MKRYNKAFIATAIMLAALLAPALPASAQVNVGIPAVQGSVGEVVEIAITVDDLTGKGILSYDFSLIYDEALLTITNSSAVTSGTRSQGGSVVVNAAKQDTVRVVAAFVSPLSGSGTLLKLKATVAAEGSTALTLANFTFNDGSPSAIVTPGQFSTGDSPPSAEAVTVSTNEDAAVSITLRGSDPEGAELGFVIASPPAHGTLGAVSVVNATSATVVYTPAANFNGSDSFSYRTTEGGRQSAAATVSITILAVNDIPITVADEAETDAGLAVVIDVTANDVDVDGDDLTAEPDPDNMPSGGTVTANGDGTLTYVPSDGFAGVDTFGYIAIDESGGRSAGEVTVDVRALVDLSIQVVDSPDPVGMGGPFTYEITTENSGPSHAGSWQILVELPVDATFEEVDTEACVYDGENHSVVCEGEGTLEESIVVSMTADGAPGATLTGSARVIARNSESLRQLDTDDSNNAVSVTTTLELDSDGISEEEENNVPNLTGDGTGDGNGDGIPDAEQENVASLVNGTDGSYITLESPTETRLIDVIVSATVPEGAPPAPESVSAPDGFLAFAVEGEVVGFATTVTIYTTKEVNSYVKYGPTPENPTPHWYEFLFDGTTGAEIFPGRVVLHLIDGQRGDADLAEDGNIEDPGAPVFNTNVGPSASNDEYETDEDIVLTVSAESGVLANDADPDGDPLQVVLISGVSNGVLTLNENGSFVYQPGENFSGTDSFTYAAIDVLAADTAEVIITVAAVNDAPEAVPIATPSAGSIFLAGGTAEGASVDGDGVLFAITWEESADVEGDEVTYRVEVSGEESFEVLIDEISTGTVRQAQVTVADAAGWVDLLRGSAELGGSATAYIRVVSSDGDLEAAGSATVVTLTRGTITSGEMATIPERFSLRGNYPNPFNPSTTILLDLPQPGEVRVQLFDVAGREVFSSGGRHLAAGAAQRVEIDAASLPSGLYIYRVTVELGTERLTATGHMTLIK